MKKLFLPAFSTIYTVFLLSLSFTAIPIENYLKNFGVYEETLTVLYAGSAFAACGLLALSAARKKWRALLLFPLLAAATLALFRTAENEAARIHLVAYTFLGILYLKTLDAGKRRTSNGWMAGTICGLVGWIGECLQLFAPNRFFEWKDVALNVAAGFMACLFFRSAEYRKEHNSY